MQLSIVIPVLNEAGLIKACLASLQELRRRGHEVIVVDGGSRDRTAEIAGPLADKVLRTGKGRARQMNAGAAAAAGNVYVFLHADTLFQFDVAHILAANVKTGLAWGRFDLCLSGQHPLLRIIEFFINLRSRFTGIATGDQAIFVTRELFDRAGGFPSIPLMEDIELSRQLKKHCRPICLKNKVITSSRRWEQYGIIRTVLKMWLLRFKYHMGINPAVLAQEYE